MKCAASLLAAMVLTTLPLPGRAGLPVTDVADIAQNTLTAVRTLQQYQQMLKAYQTQLQELEQAVKQVEALTGNRGIGELLNGGPYRAARRYTPATWQDTMRILEAGGLPGSAADVLAIYQSLTERYPIAGREEYNLVNPDAPNALAFEQRRDTNMATLAASEASYNQTQQRMENYESFMHSIETTPDMKAIGDLSARISAENGTALAELIRLNAIQMQQTASLQNQNLVDETNMKRQTTFADYAFGQLPTE